MLFKIFEGLFIMFNPFKLKTKTIFLFIDNFTKRIFIY